MGRLKTWWAETSLLGRVLASAAGLLVVGLVVAVIVEAGFVNELNEDVKANRSDVANMAAENEGLDSELDAAGQQLDATEQILSETEAEVSRLEAELEEREEDVRRLAAEDSAELTTAQQAQRDAEKALAEAERLVAQLTLAYNPEIEAARSTVSAAVMSSACGWGVERATAGVASSSLSWLGAFSAFEQSEAFALLEADPAVAAYMNVSEALGDDQFGVDKDEVLEVATGCWQTEDAKINAALYVYQGVLAEAALDAACTHGAAETYADSSISGYEATAVFQNWKLTLGDDDSRSYLRAVEDRFGTIKEFLAIPDSQVQSESDRCDDVRDLIEPKRSGTWNVGDEILPGVWKAYDVSDCYWARLAENGDISDNHFGDGLRLTVNVSSSDGQFEISGCRFYYANP